MNILVLNQRWFVDEWRAAGHTVVTCGASHDMDVVLQAPLIHIDNVVKFVPGGFSPDIVVVHDNSAPLIVIGFEETSTPCVFYSVDTHHHSHFHRYLANVFDETFIAQKDYAGEFTEVGASVRWLPLWAPLAYESSLDKKYDAVFVGTMNPRLNPERVNFFDALKAVCPLTLERGDYWKIFPHSEIVVNQTVKGDLNFRVFEGMMSGALLLTERSGNGLFDLFKEGVHLLSYEKNNVAEAGTRIRELLANKALCREIGYQGREEIKARHLQVHRAQEMLEVLTSVKKKDALSKYFSAMLVHHVAGLRFAKIDPSYGIKSISYGVKAASQGLNKGESLSDELSIHAMLSTVRFDEHFPGCAGMALLHQLVEAYPQSSLLRFGLIRQYLRTGNVPMATEQARRITDRNVNDVFTLAEGLVKGLMEETAAFSLPLLNSSSATG